LQPFEDIIKDAQKHGFAESNLTLDIYGWDSKFKFIMSNHEDFRVFNTPEEILNLDIRHEKSEDIEFAKERDFSIELIGHSTLDDQGFSAYVAPQFIPTTEALTSVDFENNAVQIDAEFAQEHLLKGKGAGSIPTDSSVLSNLVLLFENYSYGYSKASQKPAEFNSEKLIKVYLSLDHCEDLQSIKFKTEILCGTQKNLQYKIGEISVKSIQQQAAVISTELFIAVFPD
jgi:homoserine dehydrogenase